jgi:drug/metabolite transporter (DMT)-like permease
MTRNRRNALAALAVAGLLWGTTVPLSKVALGWLSPGWLALVRFAVAAAILAVVTRSRLRAACTPAILLSGAIGYGGTVLLQNAGITRTSVSHAALLIGSVPVMVAIVAALWHRAVAKPVAWAGFGVSLAGVALLAGSGGSGAALSGDLLVLASLLVSAVFTVAQDRLLPGRDPAAVTAAQFLGAALASVPAALMSGLPAAPFSGGTASAGPVLALIGLTAGGTLLPFTLFAFGQSRVPAEVAGAFLNLEPLIGAAAGVALFGDPAGTGQLLGGGAILAGIALSSVPLLRPARVNRTAVASVEAGTRAPAPVTRPGSETATAGQSRPAAGALPEDDGLVAVEQDPVVGVPADRPGQGDALGVPADGHQLGRAVRVVDPGHLLLDDRPLVQVGGDVVRGGADQLDPARVRLVIRPRALEAGQEGMVDVDDPPGQLPAERVGQHLHIAGQHDEVGPVVPDQGEDLGLLRGPGFRPDRQMVVVDAVGLGQRPQIRVVRGDRRDVDAELPRPLPEQQVVQAVPGPRHEDQDARPYRGVVQLPVQAELRRQFGQRGRHLVGLAA